MSAAQRMNINFGTPSRQRNIEQCQDFEDRVNFKCTKSPYNSLEVKNWIPSS